MTSLHADEAFLGHYQFSHDPFAARVPGFRFFPAQRKPVLGQLHHLARYSQLLLVVSGPKGSGKTLLRQALVASTNKQAVQCVVVSARGASDVGGVLRQVAQGLGVQSMDLRSILAQVAQLALTGQEVYLLVDDAEQLADAALDSLFNLAAGTAEARPHVFLFGELALVPRLELLADGEERFHAIDLLPYSEDETREYLAQRLDGAGQGIDLLTDDQVSDIHLSSGGWPGAINQAARDVLIESMLAQRNAAGSAGGGLALPKKHLLALAVVGLALGAAWFMQGKSGIDLPAPGKTAVDLLPQAAAPVSAEPSSEAPGEAAGSATSIEFAGSNQPLPLPLVGEAQPVIREPLAQASGMDEGDEASAGTAAPAGAPVALPLPAPTSAAVAPAVSAPTVAVAPPVATTVVPPVKPEPVAVPTPVPAPAPAPVAAKPVVKPVAAPAPKPAVAVRPVASAAPAAATGDWYGSQPASSYALQILGTRSEGSAKAFVAKNGGQYRYFKKLHQGQALYVVTYGQFASRAAAQAAIKSLPAAVQAGKPWPRSFASIQQEAVRAR
ncbi:cell division protein [Pseudomonas alcaligenes]|uniref:Cell division protein n=1 Tax=Aquipseudomonas alcaligenes TaxID=43263 RepID=A0ABR7RWD4_AQUAC|nr:AAA family ATPase [Pseudomonas alcaligenes]MBC9249079.1 cell division protein [Pseudomonas alcaligenes]